MSSGFANATVNIMDRLKATLRHSDSTLLELVFALFLGRFAITLLIPAFNTFLLSPSMRYFVLLIQTPTMFGLLILFGPALWYYGFSRYRLDTRRRGITYMTYTSAMIAVGTFAGAPAMSAWTIYLLMTVLGAFCLARLKRLSRV